MEERLPGADFRDGPDHKMQHVNIVDAVLEKCSSASFCGIATPG